MIVAIALLGKKPILVLSFHLSAIPSLFLLPIRARLLSVEFDDVLHLLPLPISHGSLVLSFFHGYLLLTRARLDRARLHRAPRSGATEGRKRSEASISTLSVVLHLIRWNFLVNCYFGLPSLFIFSIDISLA